MTPTPTGRWDGWPWLAAPGRRRGTGRTSQPRAVRAPRRHSRALDLSLRDCWKARHARTRERRALAQSRSPVDCAVRVADVSGRHGSVTIAKITLHNRTIMVSRCCNSVGMTRRSKRKAAGQRLGCRVCTTLYGTVVVADSAAIGRLLRLAMHPPGLRQPPNDLRSYPLSGLVAAASKGPVKALDRRLDSRVDARLFCLVHPIYRGRWWVGALATLGVRHIKSTWSLPQSFEAEVHELSLSPAVKPNPTAAVFRNLRCVPLVRAAYASG